MANSTVDIKALVRRTILESADVRALVDDRVYTSHRRDADVGDAEYPLVSFEALTGFGIYPGSLQTVTIELYAYARTSGGDAGMLYDAVYAALQAQRLYLGTEDASGARVVRAAGYARESERPLDGWNEKAGAWFKRGQWIIQTAG